MKDITQKFSKTAKNMKRSAIRELLKFTNNPDVISFAGGFPAPDLFPIEKMKEVVCEVLDEDGAKALQYGETEGDLKLRQLLVERYNKQGFNIDLKNLVIVTASQQGLDLISKVFLNRGDKVVCGLPSYLGALQAFNSYGANMIGIRYDAALDNTLEVLQTLGELPKFIYTIPDFQNPSGITMSEADRRMVLNIAEKYNVIIVEDCPYREVRFEGEHIKTIYEMDKSGRVILLGTFSKIFVPGFRLGWVVAHETIIDKIVTAKQSVDLCSPVLDQKIAAKFLEKSYLDQNIPKIIENYRRKRDVMIAAFEKYMPEGVKWTRPQGGLFLFITLPDYMDAKDLFDIAIKENVAFVLGNAFFCDGSGKNTMRINFSYMSEDMNIEGVKRLATAIRKLMK
ncbi:MAG: PLP-dependent aminotransferase family protein [Prevotellaceae bacterium]|jgi:2-aminoadipate transaminase|nr:PLP-dependent aminotransferase family protein [Prevotellaceae bacterium]